MEKVGVIEKQNTIQANQLEILIEHNLHGWLGKRKGKATVHDVFRALSGALRPQLVDGMEQTDDRYKNAGAKRLYYLSAEFLIGQSLRNNLFNLGLSDAARMAVKSFGFDLDDILADEPDAGLGNGGLGRLAACFLESLATQAMPGCGYGINYEFGLFKQEINQGFQREKPDQWLKEESPWEIQRMDESCVVPLYGRIEHAHDESGGYNPMWVDWSVLIGVPYDIPIVGFGGKTINTLRLFSARASTDFDMQVFNSGDYVRAVEQKIASETISKVLYPSDNFAAGKELRLIQEYFMVACALRDIFRNLGKTGEELRDLPQFIALQMNDTHPSLAVAELMRLLVDENSIPWDAAWEITQQTCAYTNHTLMPEALETWPVDLLEKVLPRHLQIIYEINQKFLAEVAARFPGDESRQARMSLIDEGSIRQVRMAHLAIVGSHKINGVAELHSELVKATLVPDFYEFFPERFGNVTNGVTHRRWLACANPSLGNLLTQTAGDGWQTEFSRVRSLERYAKDPGVQDEVQAIKRANKERLAEMIWKESRIKVDAASMFDVHVKRIHEYKRQLLNVLRVIHTYRCIVDDGVQPISPRTVLFAGKAAPGYHIAKKIIKLIHNVAERVNRDPRVKDMLKVVFIPNYRVTLAESIVPAADLSEQISTAGTEASGTSNMKFAMNGALTIGTLDGANVEIRNDVGPENFFLFGLITEEVSQLRGNYDPERIYQTDPAIRRAVDSLLDAQFSPGEEGIFQDLFDLLVRNGDHYMHLADFQSYVSAQQRVDQEYANPRLWAEKAIYNIARSARFTSDRSIQDYAHNIWNLQSVVQNA